MKPRPKYKKLMAYKKKSKRTLSPEQIMKMQEGKQQAQKVRDEQAKTKKRVEMLSDLDKQLSEGRKKQNSSYVKVRSKHRHKVY